MQKPAQISTIWLLAGSGDEDLFILLADEL